MTNSPQAAEKVVTITRGVAFQEAIEAGAREQWRQVAAGILAVLLVAIPGRAQYWDDLTRDPFGAREVAKARNAEFEHGRHM